MTVPMPTPASTDLYRGPFAFTGTCPSCEQPCRWVASAAVGSAPHCPCTSDPATAAAGDHASNRGNVAGSESDDAT